MFWGCVYHIQTSDDSFELPVELPHYCVRVCLVRTLAHCCCGGREDFNIPMVKLLRFGYQHRCIVKTAPFQL